MFSEVERCSGKLRFSLAIHTSKLVVMRKYAEVAGKNLDGFELLRKGLQPQLLLYTDVSFNEVSVSPARGTDHSPPQI
jgi:hypothetical protein